MNAHIKNGVQIVAITAAIMISIIVAGHVFAWTNPGGAPPFSNSALSTLGSNVGIGVTNPNTKLAVGGAVSATGIMGYNTFGVGMALGGDGTNGLLYSRNSGSWAPAYIDSTALYLNSQSGGSVGIGTASPDTNYKLTTSGKGVKAESITAQPAGYFNNTGGGPAITVGTGGLTLGGVNQTSWPVAAATSWPAVTNKSLGDVARVDAGLDIGVSQYMRWKNYGSSHIIIDASNGTAPNGSAIDNANSQAAWSGTYPTLMGWNGANTYGVRVDSARVADTVLNSNDATKVAKTGDNMTGNLTFVNVGVGTMGTYDPTKTQAVWAMSPSYALPADGATTGSLYGLGWSYEPGYGGAGNNAQSKAGLSHQLLVMHGGVTRTAIGTGVWTSGQVNAVGGLCMNGDCKSSWAPYSTIYGSVFVRPGDWFTGALDPSCVQYNNGGIYYWCTKITTVTIPAGRSYVCFLTGNEFDDRYAPTFGVNGTLHQPSCSVANNQVTARLAFMGSTPDRYDSVGCEMRCIVF